MLDSYHPHDIPTHLSHPLVDEARDSLMRAVAYLEPAKRADVLRACHFGDVAHIKDKRKSGEPYITHPIAVAEILAGFRLDRDTIIAAILHDTVEDTEVTEEIITAEFGETVARLVDGVTKLKSSGMSKQQSQAATFYKILTATLIDPRVLIVKLSDRLHNMSTLDAVSEDKQKRTARETLDFYIPFARLMGLNNIADYIELLCYRNLNPAMYNKFTDKLLQHGLGRNLQTTEISTYLQNLLGYLNLDGNVQVLDNRASMYRQFFRNRGQINQLIRQYDFEVILKDIEACDKLANYLIQKYQIGDRNIQDHIRKPLAGGNQSLTLIYERDYNHIKVTLMTRRMQESARLGIISSDRTSISQSVIQASLRNMQDLANASETEGDGENAHIDIIEELISYLHERKIVCYSPQGRAYELPRGSTALDFAYAVGPAIGNIATGADINNEHGKLGMVLADGDTVSIDTDKDATPRAEWLGFVATNKARSEILKFLKHLPEDQKIQYGKQALDRALNTYGKSIDDLNDDDWADILKWRGIQTADELFMQLSTGVLLPQLVVSRLFSEEVDTADDNEITRSKHLLAGIKGVEVDFARCCNPIYGDRIVGHLSRQGLVVHRHKCYSLQAVRADTPYQIIQLNWKPDSALQNQPDALRFPAMLRIYAMLNEEQISQVIYEMRALNIGVEQTHVKADNKFDSKSDKNKVGTTTLHVVVRSRSHLAEGIEKLRTLLGYPNIMRLYQ